ncbi:MAG: glycine/sarcosine/betaine reductase complex component C subunit alpha [Defluviitaleaceae bacterium]|nr:glycine/sarcosine/betaine reductase complex component C subunit alpha [Defluviitaleaceae bacterium]
MSEQIKKTIAKTFLDMAQGLETGSFATAKIGLMAASSEHGADELQNALTIANRKGIPTEWINEATEAESISKMEKMLATGDIDGCVAMHYNFPIGVATVGKVITPATGRVMYIATTTGTSDTDRVAGMVKNAIYGIIAAKADGIENPTIGILNIDGARKVEMALQELKKGGYPISFATSKRDDGGFIMRGNDALNNPCDIMVCDSLTGNVLMKLLSSFTTGGAYESLGYGYGPGIGEGFNNLVLIVSRASGAPVIAGAIEYAASLVKGNWGAVAKAEFAAAKKAGLQAILTKLTTKAVPTAEEAVVEPPKEVTTAEVSGIEITDLEDAVMALWREKIYAQSGMGCTGPVVQVNEANIDKAKKILIDKGFLGE